MTSSQQLATQNEQTFPVQKNQCESRNFILRDMRGLFCLSKSTSTVFMEHKWKVLAATSNRLCLVGKEKGALNAESCSCRIHSQEFGGKTCRNTVPTLPLPGGGGGSHQNQAGSSEGGRELQVVLAQGRKSKGKAHGGGLASRPALPRTGEEGWDYRCPNGGGRSSHGVAQQRARPPHPSPLHSPVLSPGFEPSVLDPHSNNPMF